MKIMVLSPMLKQGQVLLPIVRNVDICFFLILILIIAQVVMVWEPVVIVARVDHILAPSQAHAPWGMAIAAPAMVPIIANHAKAGMWLPHMEEIQARATIAVLIQTGKVLNCVAEFHVVNVKDQDRDQVGGL